MLTPRRGGVFTEITVAGVRCGVYFKGNLSNSEVYFCGCK